jgi:hypothetical protein
MRFKRPTVVESAVLVVIACVLTPLATDVYRHHVAEERGTSDARADLARGIVSYRLRGKPGPWDQDATKLASNRYGIQIIRTGACVCAGADCTYDHAYNRMVTESLVTRFGFDPIAKVFDEARDAWESRRAQART